MARVVIVAGSVADLVGKLEAAAERLRQPDCERIQDRGGIYYFRRPLYREGGLAFVFPGEGAQYPDMLADACVEFPAARAWFDLVDRAFGADAAGREPPSARIFPPPGLRDEAAPRLRDMDRAVAAVYAADRAALAVLDELGVAPDAVVGHSSGEYAALAAAGATPVPDETEMVAHIRAGAELTEGVLRDGLVPPGVLLAVGPTTPAEVRAALDRLSGSLLLTMDNCPNQAVYCGDEESVGRAERELTAAGAVCQRLTFSRAYHTPRFAPVSERLRDFYAQVPFAPPERALYSCATAAPAPVDPDELRALARAQWSSPVRFRETVEAMYADGIRLFVEVGPRDMLTGFVNDTLRRRRHAAIPTDTATRGARLHHAVALLLAHGVPIRLTTWYDTPTVPPEAVYAGERYTPPGRDGTPLDLSLPVLHPVPASTPSRPPPTNPSPPPNGTSPSAPTAASQGVAPRVGPGVGSGGGSGASGRGAGAVSAAVRGAGLGAAPSTGASAQGRHGAGVSEYLATMERFLDVQAGVMTAALGGRAAPNGSLLTGATVQRGADGVDVVRTLDLERDVFLRDHTLGPTVSERDPRLTPLPVLPLAVSLEMMIQAANQVDPGVTELRDVRADRWVPMTEPRGTVRITARRRTAGAVDAELATGDGPAAVRATVCRATPAPAPQEPLTGRRTFRWRPHELYAEGARHGMFHGPAFQCVASIDALSDRGADATLIVPGPADDVPSRARLIDAAGQVLGFWAAQELDTAFVVFPVAADTIRVDEPSTDPLTCHVRVRELDATRVRADITAVDPTGRTRLDIRGWQVRRFALPERFYAFRLDPVGAPLSDHDAGPGTVRCRATLPAALLDGEGGVWSEVLAHLVLDRDERRAWRRIAGPLDERRAWLLGRVAAKDAVRLLLRERLGRMPYPADVPIGTDAHGRPVLAGPTPDDVPVTVSIVYADGAAVAVAAHTRQITEGTEHA